MKIQPDRPPPQIKSVALQLRVCDTGVAILSKTRPPTPVKEI